MRHAVHLAQVTNVVESLVCSVLVDDPSTAAIGLYEEHGIVEGGVLVVVRPDGYVGTMCTFADVRNLSDYLSGFLQ